MVGNAYDDEERTDDLFVIMISSEQEDAKATHTCAVVRIGVLIN